MSTNQENQLLKDSGVGRFRISESIMREFPHHARLVMSECVVLRCEFLYSVMAFEYEAISIHFHRNKSLECDYEPVFETSNEGTDESPILVTRFKEFKLTTIL